MVVWHPVQNQVSALLDGLAPGHPKRLRFGDCRGSSFGKLLIQQAHGLEFEPSDTVKKKLWGVIACACNVRAGKTETEFLEIAGKVASLVNSVSSEPMWGPLSKQNQGGSQRNVELSLCSRHMAVTPESKVNSGWREGRQRSRFCVSTDEVDF